MLDIKDFGNRLAALRKNANLTQNDIARAVGVTIQAVSKWENGRNFPDLAYLDDLASVLGVEIKELFFEMGEKIG